jgi:CubicO group peptidase (beta-lactamase class C family)
MFDTHPGLRCLVVLLGLVVASLPVQAQDVRTESPNSTISSEALYELSRAVASYVDQGQIVGAELVVRQHGCTLLDAAFGWKNRELRERMEPGTIFNIRSMTKAMVGAVVQMIVDEGRLSLDDQASQFLPGFDRRGSREITVDQLLTHRSGLPLSVVTSLTRYSRLYEMANAIGEHGPDFEPGARFWYSDAGANALGAVIEVVEGAPLAEVIERRILEPLGLDGTFPGSDGSDERWDRVATMYARMGREWVPGWMPQRGPFYPLVWGSQGMLSTPVDYARFVETLVDDRLSGDGQLLSSRAVASMREPVSEKTVMGSSFPEPTNFSNMEFRYGRMLEVRVPEVDEGSSTGPIIGHTGSDGTAVWAWPERDLVIAYFTSSRGNATHLRLERVIERSVLGHDLEVTDTEPTEAQYLVGSYHADCGRFAGADVLVIVQDGRLALDVPGSCVSELGPADEAGLRKVPCLPSASVSFEMAADGRAVGLIWHESDRSLLLPRAEQSTSQSRDVQVHLSDYVGTYRIAGSPLEPDVELIDDDGFLAVLIPEQPTPLRLRMPDEEGYWVLDRNPQLRIRFARAEDGEVVSYTASGPDGTQTVREKVSNGLRANTGDSGRRPGLRSEHTDTSPNEGVDR